MQICASCKVNRSTLTTIPLRSRAQLFNKTNSNSSNLNRLTFFIMLIILLRRRTRHEQLNRRRTKTKCAKQVLMVSDAGCRCRRPRWMRRRWRRKHWQRWQYTGNSDSSTLANAVNPTSLDFGKAVVGQTGQRTVTISNTGTLELTGVQLTSPVEGYSAAGPC